MEKSLIEFFKMKTPKDLNSIYIKVVELDVPYLITADYFHIH